MNKILPVLPIGTKVRDKFTGVSGTIASAPFDVRCDTMYAVRLDTGHWTEGRDIYISHIVQNAGCIVVIPKA